MNRLILNVLTRTLICLLAWSFTSVTVSSNDSLHVISVLEPEESLADKVNPVSKTEQTRKDIIDRIQGEHLNLSQCLEEGNHQPADPGQLLDQLEQLKTTSHVTQDASPCERSSQHKSWLRNSMSDWAKSNQEQSALFMVDFDQEGTCFYSRTGGIDPRQVLRLEPDACEPGAEESCSDEMKREQLLRSMERKVLMLSFLLDYYDDDVEIVVKVLLKSEMDALDWYAKETLVEMVGEPECYYD